MKISHFKSWFIEDVALIAPQVNKRLRIAEVSYDDGATYLKDVTLVTTPQGSFSFYDAYFGVVITHNGPQELVFEASQDNGGSSLVVEFLSCSLIKD